MASVKVKFRSSVIKGKMGTVYFQITQHRVTRTLKSKYKIYPDEWNESKKCIVLSSSRPERQHLLIHYEENIKKEFFSINECIATLNSRYNKNYSCDELLNVYQRHKNQGNLSTFMVSLIEHLKAHGHVRTGETYQCALNSFMNFRNGQEILLDEINQEIIENYETYLRHNNLSMNTISFYMRILRATYNRAVDKDLTTQQHPFRHVYTGVEKTTKRAVSIQIIKRIKEKELSNNISVCYARDMFLFSFYTRGMSFIDMAYLKKKDLCNGILTYRRKKTGQQLHIKWEKCMQAIINKYPHNTTEYLLPIILYSGEHERQQYRNALTLINRKLKILSAMVRSPHPLSMYVARHSWASIAKSKKIPISIISEGMGHDSETTTQIYLASLDHNIIDRANRLILHGL